MPQVVVSAFSSMGYEPDDIKDISNIDVGLSQIDTVSGKRYVTYALYTDEDINSDDIIEVTIAEGKFWIQGNGETMAFGDTDYRFDEDTEEPIGTTYQVDEV